MPHDQNADRSTEEIRIGWPGFASVSPPLPERFQEVVEADESADDAPPPEGASEIAARSLANGASLAAVARWFDVPESQLLELIAGEGGRAGADPAVADVTESSSKAGVLEPELPRPDRDRDSARPAPASDRPTAVRSGPAAYSSNGPIGTRSRPQTPSRMGIRESLQLLRRRVLIVVLALLLGAVVGWVSAPGKTHRTTTFQATHTLIYEPGGNQNYNIGQVALLATSGDVPSRVALRLKMDRAQVRASVSAAALGDVGTISITGRGSAPVGAVSLADVTAEELMAAIDGGARTAYQAEIDRLNAQVQTARDRLNAVPPKNTAAQAAAQSSLETAERTLEQYKSAGPPKSQLRTLETATASVVAPAGVRAPDSKPVRAALLGLIGLMGGLAGAFALDRADTRIRSKERAEEAFGVPVVAEVPRLEKSFQGQLLARTQPSSPFVEAYRGLRTYVALWAPESDREDGHRVIVVTSPSAGEGKTTTVAHLAAMLAEIGRSVVVISADLRRPRLHEYFDLPPAPGLVDALAAKSSPPVFHGLDQPTSVRGVRLIPSGAPVENPAPLFEHAARLLNSVRGMADFVLVDAPPLLVANDAVEMARYADGVLLVARAGQTPIEAAERTAEIFERLEIPRVGAVLVASESASNASRYYASRYYAEPERAGWLRRRPAGVNGHAPAAAETPPEGTESLPAEEASGTVGGR